MYLAGISVRRVEDITEALWGHRGWGAQVLPEGEKIRSKFMYYLEITYGEYHIITKTYIKS